MTDDERKLEVQMLRRDVNSIRNCLVNASVAVDAMEARIDDLDGLQPDQGRIVYDWKKEVASWK